MQVKSKVPLGSLLVATMAAAAVALPSAAQAGPVSPAATAGDLCTINATFGDAPVYPNANYYETPLYTLHPGQLFRVEALVTSTVFYRGHGTNLSSGYLRRDQVDQTSCHQ